MNTNVENNSVPSNTQEGKRIVSKKRQSSLAHKVEGKLKLIQEKSSLHEQIFNALLPYYIGQIKEYEKRFVTLDNTAHINATDPLILAITDKTRYEKLNMYAAEWLVGDNDQMSNT